jgi:ABC-type Fe3+/spermidine/putrescine transport system ATPase subunit
MLEAREINKWYEGQPLLSGVSFSLRDRETVCLLGPSGSGKTTLLQILAGLLALDGGRVYWDGVDLTNLPPHQRDFGLVFQDSALFPHLDVQSNVAFGLKMRGLESRRLHRRVAEVLSLVKLDGFERRAVDQLSGGEQQRVALARALAPRPRLLMLDEPLSSLDHALRHELQAELRRVIRESGVPALYVTHDQEEAFALGQRILILHRGRIVCHGTPAEIVARPCSGWTAQFLALGTVIPGTVQAFQTGRARVDTQLGIIDCVSDREMASGQSVAVLLRADAIRIVEPRGPTTHRVVDVVFQRNGYEVTLESGLQLHSNNPPEIGSAIGLEVIRGECLPDD